MKIVICGSMSSACQMVDAKKELLQNNHEVILPKNTEQYAEKVLAEETAHESTKNKIEHDLIRDYFEKIKNADAVLVVNVDKKGISNYIGGNSFLEIGFAHILNKPIFIMNFFFKDTATTEIYSLSLHDALPIFHFPSQDDPCPTVQSVRCSNYTYPSLDRKSTRLNSSHDQISYAVFCLKKNEQQQLTQEGFLVGGGKGKSIYAERVC